jgi:glycosyltransferase involved in cell wall biosynthesis
LYLVFINALIAEADMKDVRETPAHSARLTRAVAVFAHNESLRIIKCLDSLRNAGLPENTTCYVLVNGCTDDTYSRAVDYAGASNWVKVVKIDIGDKAMAWNHFVHDMGIEADFYFFTDGDCTIDPGALQALEHAMVIDPVVNAVSGVPAKRNFSLGLYREAVVRDRGLAGNLYALSGNFVARIRALGIRLPKGLVGDDSLVGAIALWNADPTAPWDTTRLQVIPDATFRYESVLAASLNDPAFYFKRLKRYSVRHVQNQLIRNRIKTIGFTRLPADVNLLYADSKSGEVAPRRSAAYYFFDQWAIHKLIAPNHSGQGRRH